MTFCHMFFISNSPLNLGSIGSQSKFCLIRCYILNEISRTSILPMTPDTSQNVGISKKRYLLILESVYRREALLQIPISEQNYFIQYTSYVKQSKMILRPSVVNVTILCNWSALSIYRQGFSKHFRKLIIQKEI